MQTTRILHQVRSLTRMNVVDNSRIGAEVKAAGKLVKIIRVYNKTRHQMGGLGDRVLVTVLGQMKKAIIVGCVQTQRPFVPRYDRNNLVFVDNQNVPLGTRITVPIPNYLRSKGPSTARLMAIATKFL